ncbi:hypothetical protein ACJ72_06303 [Emergomyces africanus]|uniref:DNA mismatch repair protein S5 domain-containing protein n=1 Tax=Emergomyces africanus TaxID=1955775 RepID=A0A1B7NRG6_9EURO|nr:hypothetical protein ACJ72_06303 [Emergomyces africanus]
MAIDFLPPDCARAVRSASELSDPCSVVKELIDNSLDAGATCISVEVSANVLDIIQVKDNGTGIHPNDRHLVCKRSCTSKLQTIDDLKKVGGNTLGFRGEALASAAEMCGGILITTRTDGELVAASLRYDRAGLLVSCTKASHPIGTTVRVSEYLRFVPVRKQTTLKNTSKTISRMKKILNAYVLSRPEIRLCFKILKSRHDHSWTYASKENATVFDAMLKIVGGEATSQCDTVVWPQTQDDEDGFLSGSKECNDSNCPVLQLVAITPKPGYDCTKINNAGHGSITFMQLHCRPGSYDINVEPSKDDVLFEDSKLVLSMAEDLFKNVYGEIKPKDTPRSTCRIEEKGSFTQANQPRSLAASRHHTSEAERPAFRPAMLSYAVKDCHSNSHTRPSSLQAKASNASTRYSADIVSYPQPARDNAFLSNRPTNPWMLAKRQHRTTQKENTQSRDLDSYLLTPVHEDEPFRFENTTIENCRTNSVLASPLSPSPRFMRAPEAQLARSTNDKLLANAGKSLRSELHLVPQIRVFHDPAQRREFERTGNLESWIRNCQDSFNKSLEEGHHVGISDETCLAETAIAGRFGKQSHCNGTCRNKGDSPVESSSSILLSAPGINQCPAHMIIEGDDPQPVISSEKYDDQLSRIRESGSSHLNSSSQNIMVAEALNFEYRKKAAVQLYRQKQQQQLVSPPATFLSWAGADNAKTPQSSPYQNRYIGATADLASRFQEPEFPGYEAASSLSKMELEDPRAHFMRHKSALTLAGVNSKRESRNLLPLEAIPEEFALHGLCINWDNQDDKSLTPGNELSKTDEYIRTGIVPPPPAFFEVQLSDISFWTRRLLALIQEQYRSENGNGDGVGGTQLVFDSVSNITCNNIVTGLKASLKSHLQVSNP